MKAEIVNEEGFSAGGLAVFERQLEKNPSDKTVLEILYAGYELLEQPFKAQSYLARFCYALLDEGDTVVLRRWLPTFSRCAASCNEMRVAFCEVQKFLRSSGDANRGRRQQVRDLRDDPRAQYLAACERRKRDPLAKPTPTLQQCALQYREQGPQLRLAGSGAWWWSGRR